MQVILAKMFEIDIILIFLGLSNTFGLNRSNFYEKMYKNMFSTFNVYLPELKMC